MLISNGFPILILCLPKSRLFYWCKLWKTILCWTCERSKACFSNWVPIGTSLFSLKSSYESVFCGPKLQGAKKVEWLRKWSFSAKRRVNLPPFEWNSLFPKLKTKNSSNFFYRCQIVWSGNMIDLRDSTAHEWKNRVRDQNLAFALPK